MRKAFGAAGFLPLRFVEDRDWARAEQLDLLTAVSKILMFIFSFNINTNKQTKQSVKFQTPSQPDCPFANDFFVCDDGGFVTEVSFRFDVIPYDELCKFLLFVIVHFMI